MQLNALFPKAGNLPDEEIDYRNNELEARIGSHAFAVLAEGDVLTYDNDTFRKTYLRLADAIAFNPEAPPVAAFQSIQSLREYTTSSVLDLSRLSLYHRILHDDACSRGYLNALADTGILHVDGNAHWSATGKSVSARGGSILRKIDHEIMLIFDELGLGHPRIQHHQGQVKMLLDSKTQEYVRQVRDYVKNAQS